MIVFLRKWVSSTTPQLLRAKMEQAMTWCFKNPWCLFPRPTSSLEAVGLEADDGAGSLLLPS